MVAAAQHGVVSRAQLEALGVGRGAVAHWIRSGRLHRVQRGVYALGHPRVSGHGRWLAATLSCGPGAALSHASAAALWGIRPSASRYVDVSVPTANGRAHRPGLRLHRGVGPLEATVHEAITVTTPAVPCSTSHPPSLAPGCATR